jgi:hypothetical protein
MRPVPGAQSDRPKIRSEEASLSSRVSLEVVMMAPMVLSPGSDAAHDVFISYSSLDKPVADAVCATLEQRGVRCWIAPRDILAGTDWGEAIIRGIEGSRLMVLVFSSHANASQQIKREVERAVNKGLAIVPFRIEDVVPERSLEYFLSSPHWLDAMTPPLEHHLAVLGDTIAALLQGATQLPSDPRTPARTPEVNTPQALPRWLAPAAIAAVLLVVAGFLGIRALNSGGGNGTTTTGTVSADVDARFVGHWNTTATSGGLTQKMDSVIKPDGAYTTSQQFDEAGRIVFPANGAAGNIFPDGGQERVFHWTEEGDTASLVFELIPDGVSSFIQGSGPKALNDFLATGYQTTWKRTSHSQAADTWELDATWGGEAWTMILNDKADGTYTFSARTVDTGKLFASAGTLKVVSDALGLINGEYQFTGSDSVAVTLAGASAVWKRASQ